MGKSAGEAWSPPASSGHDAPGIAVDDMSMVCQSNHDLVGSSNFGRQLADFARWRVYTLFQRLDTLEQPAEPERPAQQNRATVIETPVSVPVCGSIGCLSSWL